MTVMYGCQVLLEGLLCCWELECGVRAGGCGGRLPWAASGGRGGGGRARSGSESGHGLFSGSWIRRGALGCATGREAFDLYLMAWLSGFIHRVYAASCVMRHASCVPGTVLYSTQRYTVESIPYYTYL